MNKYPEWFVGGPLDGKDKTVEYSTIPNWSVVRAVDFRSYSFGIDVLFSTEQTEWLYRMDKFTFGALVIPFWTDWRFMSREIIATRLGELVMAPHKKEMEASTNDRES